MRSILAFALLVASASATLVSGRHGYSASPLLERRNSHETRQASPSPSYGGNTAAPYGGGSSPDMMAPHRRRYPARQRPYGHAGSPSPRRQPGYPEAAAEEDCDEEEGKPRDVSPAVPAPAPAPEATTTCTEEYAVATPAPVPDYGGSDSGVENSGEQACEAVTVTVTATEQVPVPEYITSTVTETVDRPVTTTQTVEVTSVQVETTTVVQPVYQTETVTCTETLPPVHETVYQTVEHTVHQTATQTVYAEPTRGVDNSGEQQSAYPEKKAPSAYPEAVAPSAY